MLLTEHGQVYTWGGGSRGQLGHGTLASEEKPRSVMRMMIMMIMIMMMIMMIMMTLFRIGGGATQPGAGHTTTRSIPQVSFYLI